MLEHEVEDRFIRAAYLLSSISRLSQGQAELVIKRAVNVSLNGGTPCVVCNEALHRAIEMGHLLDKEKEG